MNAEKAAGGGRIARLWRWLFSGSAWNWYSLFLLAAGALLVLLVLVLIGSQTVRLFWPDRVEEWVLALPGNGSERLFVQPGRRLRLPAGDALHRASAGGVDHEAQAADTVPAQMIRYQTRLEHGGVVWRQRAAPLDEIIRRSRPYSLLLARLQNGTEVAGYALAVIEEQPQPAPAAVDDAGPQAAADGEPGAGAAGPAATTALEPLQLQDLVSRLQEADGAAAGVLVMELHDRSRIRLPLRRIAVLELPNQSAWREAAGQAADNAWRFLTNAPGDARTGILPAVYGTLVLVLVMSVLLVPVGVLTAIYLHEYAGSGWFAGLLRASISNLAGIPGIVFGVFVLGFFIYGLGGQLDQWLFARRLPQPTLGTGALVWGSLALALLTLPVVVVATEEGLSRIPQRLRRASLALGATRAEMVWGVVMRAARPALLTGLILAVARAAGEVAPLLLVGAVATSGQPLIDTTFPYLHGERPFMHLGYQVFAFSNQAGTLDQAAALAYATTVVLILLVMILNLFAFTLRARLQHRFSY